MTLLDRFRHWFRSIRSLALRRLPQLPRVLNLQERLVLAGGALVLVVGIALLATSWYRGHTDLRPAAGGTYVEGVIGEPRFVNPLFATANDVDGDLVRLLYAGLFRIDDHGAVVPDLAERFDISADGKTVTVVLRPGVRWHDGAEITANDVLFTIHLLQDASAASPLRSAFRGVVIDRVDDRTVTLTN